MRGLFTTCQDFGDIVWHLRIFVLSSSALMVYPGNLVS